MLPVSLDCRFVFLHLVYPLFMLPVSLDFRFVFLQEKQNDNPEKLAT
jgi:hypothetical protein